MSDTPRTDAACARLAQNTGSVGFRDLAILHELCKELERENLKYIETMHDGHAVYLHLTDQERGYTTPENVGAVLNAFKRTLHNIHPKP
jgi:hypothetical protein